MDERVILFKRLHVKIWLLKQLFLSVSIDQNHAFKTGYQVIPRINSGKVKFFMSVFSTFHFWYVYGFLYEAGIDVQLMNNAIIPAHSRSWRLLQYFVMS